MTNYFFIAQEDQRIEGSSPIYLILHQPPPRWLTRSWMAWTHETVKTDHIVEIPFKKLFKIQISRAKTNTTKVLSHLIRKNNTVTVQRKCNRQEENWKKSEE